MQQVTRQTKRMGRVRRRAEMRGAPASTRAGDEVDQLKLPLVGGRITYEQSLLLPLITREDGRRVLTERQIRENPELWKLVHGPYRGCFKPLWSTMEHQFREPDHRGRVKAYEAPTEEWMPWTEGIPVP